MEAQEKIKVVSIIFYTVSVIIVLMGIVFTLMSMEEPDFWWGTVTFYVLMVLFFILSLGTGLYIKKQSQWKLLNKSQLSLDPLIQVELVSLFLAYFSTPTVQPPPPIPGR